MKFRQNLRLSSSMFKNKRTQPTRFLRVRTSSNLHLRTTIGGALLFSAAIEGQVSLGLFLEMLLHLSYST